MPGIECFRKKTRERAHSNRVTGSSTFKLKFEQNNAAIMQWAVGDSKIFCSAFFSSSSGSELKNALWNALNHYQPNLVTCVWLSRATYWIKNQIDKRMPTIRWSPNNAHVIVKHCIVLDFGLVAGRAPVRESNPENLTKRIRPIATLV